MKIWLLLAAQAVVMLAADALYSISLRIALLAVKLDDTVGTRHLIG